MRCLGLGKWAALGHIPTKFARALNLSVTHCDRESDNDVAQQTDERPVIKSVDPIVDQTADAKDDAALLARIATHDEAALRVFFGRHRTGVYRFLARFVRNDAVAEELTNEVFIEVWRHADRFEGRSKPTTWLLSIARNRAISTMRKRQEASWDEDKAGELEDESDDPEVVAQKIDKGARLRIAIAELSREHAEIIDLVYYHERSILEISEIVGIPQGTVKTRMFHARKKLSEIMAAQGIDRGWP